MKKAVSKAKSGMKNKMKRMSLGTKAICLLLGLVCLVGGIYYIARDNAKADGVSIQTYDGKLLSTESAYDMTIGEMSLELKYGSDVNYENENDFIVSWNIETGSEFIELTGGSSQVFHNAIAKAPGEATISVAVYQRGSDGSAGTRLDYVRGRISVVFSVDTSWNNNIFKYVYENDTNRALVMHAGDSSQTMRLNFGSASNAQWEMANTEVATVGLNTGVVTPIGAGFTTLTATYTPSGSTDTYTATLDVYVIPRASKTDGNYSTTPTVQIDSGEYIYTDAVFSNNYEVIRSKVYWSIRQDDGSGNRVEIANSRNLDSELISITPTSSSSNQMQVIGTAGVYYVYFYSYNPSHASGITDLRADGGYDPTIMTITIKSAIVDKEVTLGIGDVLSLAQSYNMTVKDFLDTFSVQVRMGPNGTGDTAGNYASYNSTSTDVTALREGIVYATMTVKTGKENYVKNLKGLTQDDTIPAMFNTKITIIDGITLGSKSIVIMVGQEYQLTASLHGTYTGAITWTSSNNSFVTVDESGLIKGIKVTTNDVTISASVRSTGGITRTDTCLVKVEAAMTNFTLNPSGNQTMNVGDYLTVVASIKETVSQAPLEWMSSNEDIITVEPAADGKSAIVYGKAGGTARLIVRNTLNGGRVNLDVEVVVPLDTLEFSASEVTYRYYQGGHNMKQELTIGPANATSKTLQWSVSNTAVATIDSEGYLAFKNPGTIILSVRPEYNPNLLLAQITVTITGTPDNISFDNLTNDQLALEVSEEKIVNLKFEPDTATTNLIWSQSKVGIVRLDYDAERKQLHVIGQSVGTAVITCRTDDNMYYSFDVTVTMGSTGITFPYDLIEIINGDAKRGTFQLEPTLIPAGSTDKVTYASRNTNIATVDASTGLVTGKSAGTTQVTATTSAGRVAIVDVLVIDSVTGLTQSFTSGTVYIGETLTIAPEVVPSTASNKTINWSWTSLDEVGAISITGTSSVDVTGVTAGTVSLIGVSADNKAAIVSYVLRVTTRKPVYNTKVTLSPAVKYLNVGKSFTVTRKVTGAKNGIKTLKWKSSKKSVATVTQKGKVKAKKVGKTTITATAQDGSKKKGTMKVVVRRLVTKIKLNKSSANILVGKSVKLSAKITPSNATVKGVTWKSSDTAIATVNGGKVIGQSPGIVKITATSKDVGKKKASCWVTVSENVPVTSFTVANSSLIVPKGKSVQSGISTNPANATNSVKYWSDNTSVATVSARGKITTKKVGQATIYARASNGVEAFVDVTVVDLNRKAVTMRQYDTEQLNVMGISEGITWYSANPQIASVSTSGLVTGRKAGVTTIYAKIDSVTLGCRVTVKKIT